MAFTNNNDSNMLQPADIDKVGAGEGSDTYLVTSGMTAGQIVTITDGKGENGVNVNTLWLVEGLTIANSSFAAGSLQLVLSNGATINVVGYTDANDNDRMDNFNFVIGGKPLLDQSIAAHQGITYDYPTFAVAEMGAPSVPTGDAIVTGVANTTTNADGTTSNNGGGGGATFTLDLTRDADPATAGVQFDVLDDREFNGDTTTHLTDGDEIIDGSLDAQGKQTLQTGDKIEDESKNDTDTLTAMLIENLGTAGVDATANTDPEDGPILTNIEEVTITTDPATLSVINVTNVTGNEKILVNSTTSSSPFTSDHDAASNLEVRGLDGDEIGQLIAGVHRNDFNVSEIENEAEIILHDKFTALGLDSVDAHEDETATVNLKGAQITLGLYSDKDDSTASSASGVAATTVSTGNDGGGFGELKLVASDEASVVTLATDTALHNVTDGTTTVGASATYGTSSASAAKDTDSTAAMVGEDQSGMEGSMRTISANDGTNNSNLASSVVLLGDQDITIKGTAIQLDEAVIKEQDDDAQTSFIDLTIKGAKEVAGPVDLTKAEVDRIKVSAEGSAVPPNPIPADTITEYMEINVDEDTVVEVRKISQNDALIITGDSENDILEIALATGTNDAAGGTLILGGDASATTTDAANGSSSSDGAGSSSNPDVGSAAVTAKADAASAIITVEKTSNLEILDVSQLTNETFSIKGAASLTIDELVMGSHGPNASDDSATYLNAKEMTGSLKISLSIDNNYDGETADTTEITAGGGGGHDDGGGSNADILKSTTPALTDSRNSDGTAVETVGSGNQLELGSGADVVENVGIVSPDKGGYDFGDNISLGDGDDVVYIGSSSDRGNATAGSDQNDNAVSAEIIGGLGDDTFVFMSNLSTDEGEYKADTDGSEVSYFAEAGAPKANLGNTDQSGVSLVRIKDFETGQHGDELAFDLFRDYDGNALSTDKDSEGHGHLYQSGAIVSATDTDEIDLDDGHLVLISVADLDTFKASSISSLFSDPQATTVPNAAFMDSDVGDAAATIKYEEYIFVVGEEEGNAGVKLFYVREGFATAADAAEATAAVDNVEATLIGQVFNDSATIFNINSFDATNFDFV